MSLTPKGFAYMTYKLKMLCPKLIFALEGGYNLKTLVDCSEAVIRILLGQNPPFKKLKI